MDKTETPVGDSTQIVPCASDSSKLRRTENSDCALKREQLWDTPSSPTSSWQAVGESDASTWKLSGTQGTPYGKNRRHHCLSQKACAVRFTQNSSVLFLNVWNCRILTKRSYQVTRKTSHSFETVDEEILSGYEEDVSFIRWFLWVGESRFRNNFGTARGRHSKGSRRNPRSICQKTRYIFWRISFQQQLANGWAPTTGIQDPDVEEKAQLSSKSQASGMSSHCKKRLSVSTTRFSRTRSTWPTTEDTQCSSTRTLCSPMSRSNPSTFTIPGAYCQIRWLKETHAGSHKACYRVPFFSDNISPAKNPSQWCLSISTIMLPPKKTWHRKEANPYYSRCDAWRTRGQQQQDQYHWADSLADASRPRNHCGVQGRFRVRGQTCVDSSTTRFPKGWIRGNTKTGPVLEVTTSYLHGKYGVEIRIESINKDTLTRGSEFLMAWISWSRTWATTRRTTTTSRKPLRCSSKILLWKRMYLLLRADEMLKQNHKDVLLPAQELYLSVKDIGLILSQNYSSIAFPVWKQQFFDTVIYFEKKMERLNSWRMKDYLRNEFAQSQHWSVEKW